MEVICKETNCQMEDVILKYNEMLFRLAMVRMNNKEDAQDVVQDTFIRLMTQIKKGKTFTDEEHLKAWLLTVTINRSKSLLMTAWNRKTEGMDSVKEMAAPEASTNYAYEYVMRLPEKYRVAIVLFYYEQLTVEEIAKILMLKPSTVRTHLTRARQRLSKLLKEDI